MSKLSLIGKKLRLICVDNEVAGEVLSVLHTELGDVVKIWDEEDECDTYIKLGKIILFRILEDEKDL